MALYACQKDVILKEQSSNFEAKVFIECILYPSENPKVYLSKSPSFFNEKVTPQEIFIHGANVTISNNNQIYTLYADSTFDKFRCRWVPFYTIDLEIKYGDTYALKITSGGKEYLATTTIDQPKVNLDKVEYIVEFVDVYGGHDGVILNFKDADSKGSFYRFQMDRWMDTTRHHAHILDVIKNTCVENNEKFFVTDLGRTVFNDIGNNGGEMKLNIEVSFEYLKGDTAYVYLQSLDERSAEFYKDLDNQLLSILNPFVEPTFIHTKIKGAIGIFGSAVRSDPILFIYPQDFP